MRGHHTSASLECLRKIGKRRRLSGSPSEERGLESPQISSSTAVTTNEEFIHERIDQARKKYEPISRRMIALQLGKARGVAFKEALDIVDAYCDEKEPAVPGYVSGEFRIYWLKAVAVAVAALGVAVLWYGTNLFNAKGPAWIPFCIGTVIVGLGALAWVKSLQSEGGNS